MIKKVDKFIKNPFFMGSVIMVFGSNLTNFINYLYHFLMGRLLNEPASYGVLASLISLLGLLGLMPSFLNLVIVKFTSEAKTEDEVRSLIYWLNKKLLLFGFLVLLFIITISSFLASYLHISSSLLIILVGVTFLFYLQSFFYRAVLQGLLKFHQSVLSQLIENITKLIMSNIYTKAK